MDLFFWPFYPEQLQPLESSQGVDLAVQTCRNLTDKAQLEEMFYELMLLLAAQCLAEVMDECDACHYFSLLACH